MERRRDWEWNLSYSFIFNKSSSEHTIQGRQSIPVHPGVTFHNTNLISLGAPRSPGSPQRTGSASERHLCPQQSAWPGKAQCMLVSLSQILSLLSLQPCSFPISLSIKAKGLTMVSTSTYALPAPYSPGFSHLGSTPSRQGPCTGLHYSSPRCPLGVPVPLILQVLNVTLLSKNVPERLTPNGHFSHTAYFLSPIAHNLVNYPVTLSCNLP